MADIWALFAAVILALVALMQRHLGNSPVTMPMICLGAGFVLFHFGGVPFDVMDGGLEVVAEITLAIILFSDASLLKSSALRREAGWPARMLLAGLPLAIVIGTLVFLVLLPGLPFWQAALIAALLAPTDAALGQAVFTNPAVPKKIRDTLTTESGLNDGLALPAIIFLACASVGFDHDLSQSNWVVFALKQVVLGILTGALLGMAGGWGSHRAVENGLAVEDNTAVFGILLVAITYLAADTIGGNGFVAVFVAGFFFGSFAKECADRTREFLETDGYLLMMIAFFYIGAIMLPKGLVLVDWRIILVVLLSLFLIRPLAIWLSLLGSGAKLREALFLGWFGPRGLATALFTLLVLHEFHDKLVSDVILGVAALAVTASTVLHGVSAHFAAALCGGDADDQPETAT